MTTPLPRPKRKKKGEGGGSGTLRADREKAGLTGGGDIHALPPEDGELLELDPETISPNTKIPRPHPFPQLMRPQLFGG
jgi:hypothetical protein